MVNFATQVNDTPANSFIKLKIDSEANSQLTIHLLIQFRHAFR
ncbi:hypothetical protein SAMN02787100_1308 [Chryseobacterium sp. OV279]|nr:hypothetical protein SAMN02787100_1308 [Chryseobacterium sp. OV279]